MIKGVVQNAANVHPPLLFFCASLMPVPQAVFQIAELMIADKALKDKKQEVLSVLCLFLIIWFTWVCIDSPPKAQLWGEMQRSSFLCTSFMLDVSLARCVCAHINRQRERRHTRTERTERQRHVLAFIVLCVLRVGPL